MSLNSNQLKYNANMELKKETANSVTTAHGSSSYEQIYSLSIANPKSSFPKKVLFYRIIGPLSVILMIASSSILMAKNCTQAITSEWQARQLLDQEPEQVRAFVSTFFYKLYLLHSMAIICLLFFILFCYVDLAPKNDLDLKYAFHFFSIFLVFTVSLCTIYASFVAFERPCLAPEGVKCCQVIGTVSVFDSNSDKESLTAISAKETSMIAIMVLDLTTGILLLATIFIYCGHVRQDAAECGYLHQVHNKTYIIRY